MYLEFWNHKNPLYVFKPISIIEQQIYRVLRNLILSPIWCLYPHNDSTIKRLCGEREFPTSLHRLFYFGALLIFMIFLTQSNIIETLSYALQTLTFLDKGAPEWGNVMCVHSQSGCQSWISFPGAMKDFYVDCYFSEQNYKNNIAYLCAPLFCCFESYLIFNKRLWTLICGELHCILF